MRYIPLTLKNIPAVVTEKVGFTNNPHYGIAIAVVKNTGSSEPQFISDVTGQNVGVSGRLGFCKVEVAQQLLSVACSGSLTKLDHDFTLLSVESADGLKAQNPHLIRASCALALGKLAG